MRNTFLFALALLFFTNTIQAATPTQTLEIAVNRLIEVAADKVMDDTAKKQALSIVLSEEIDFNSLSRRVVSKNWKKATEEQKTQFKKLFLNIMTDTYFSLLKNYNNEKVLFTKEQIKQTKKNTYAIVDTKIKTSDKTIPVRYRLIKNGDTWKIYDFIPEGISIVTTYKNNYSKTLKKKGMQGLLDDMTKSQSKTKG
ncbi:MAG: ABC transporter substrate-binding protein [Enterobacterales bacterium]|nr:ABC transporter substrate-binding protein [Enterobacterales bacterium]